jgi:hypothetical protein
LELKENRPEDQNEKSSEMIESFVKQANEHYDRLFPGSVSSILLDAVSRFDVLVVASNAKSLNDEREPSIRCFIA